MNLNWKIHFDLMFKALLLLLLSLFFWTCDSSQKNNEYPFENLSDYGFFVGEMKALSAATNLLPYKLNSALFSDYTEKSRYIYLPPSKKVGFKVDEVFDFPEGTIIIKNFYVYTSTERNDKERRILETRLLINTRGEWKSYPYVWNEDQKDARLLLSGSVQQVKLYNEAKEFHEFEYVSPSVQQCKSCHNLNGKISPIGPKAINLTRTLPYKSGEKKQLDFWKEHDLFENYLPLDAAQVMPDYNDTSAALDARARAYLDINCAHCHRRDGPASTSGMYLQYQESSKTALGIYKTPVASGKGSGGHSYGILPGHSDRSIMVYRMLSKDPGAMMPETGRSLLHQEGIKLIREWIDAMSPNEEKS